MKNSASSRRALESESTANSPSTVLRGILGKVIAALMFLSVVSLTIALWNSLAFKTLNSIRVTEAIPRFEPGATPLDAEAFLAGVRYRDEEMVYAVRPASRYQRAIVEGSGNCSNRSFGAAYYLLNQGIPFQIVHLFPRGTFLSGDGHTVLRTEYTWAGRTRIALLDVLLAGAPTHADKRIDVDDLIATAPTNHYAVRQIAPRSNPFWGDYGDYDAVPGIISDVDVARYYAFLDRVYVPLGNEKLEKYVFDGLALLIGAAPPIHVERQAGLLDDYRLHAVVYRSALWVLRIASVALPLLLLLLLLVLPRGSRKRSSRSADRRSSLPPAVAQPVRRADYERACVP